jgi:uncharacterized repeat protein (TIGR03843 family)
VPLHPPIPVPEVLAAGELELVGRMPWSSNATFLAEARLGDECQAAIYKPQRGERPLWDFPRGIYKREIAAYAISEALGWGLVPPTVERSGPLGPGSVQQFIESDSEEHYFTLVESGDESVVEQLRTVCCFDLLVNNTDRKSGHCLLGHGGHIWAIDNALAFHAEFKLRTVIWDFAGDAISETLLADVAVLVDRGLPAALDELLDPFEREALRTRARALLAERRFPADTTGHRYPWPLV